jgi:hypothetical protein
MLSARRLAGSIVKAITRLPERAAATLIAAETLVLPTPPEPAQTITRRVKRLLRPFWGPLVAFSGAFTTAHLTSFRERV